MFDIVNNGINEQSICDADEHYFLFQECCGIDQIVLHRNQLIQLEYVVITPYLASLQKNKGFIERNFYLAYEYQALLDYLPIIAEFHDSKRKQKEFQVFFGMTLDSFITSKCL